MSSWGNCKFSKNTYLENSFSGYFWHLTLVFKNFASVNKKYHVQLQKSIGCSEKSEGATRGILLKKTCNFIRKRRQYCEVLYTPILKIICERLLLKISISVTNFSKEGNYWFVLFFSNPFKRFATSIFAIMEWFCI